MACRSHYALVGRWRILLWEGSAGQRRIGGFRHATPVRGRNQRRGVVEDSSARTALEGARRPAAGCRPPRPDTVHRALQAGPLQEHRRRGGLGRSVPDIQAPQGSVTVSPAGRAVWAQEPPCSSAATGRLLAELEGMGGGALGADLGFPPRPWTSHVRAIGSLTRGPGPGGRHARSSGGDSQEHGRRETWQTRGWAPRRTTPGPPADQRHGEGAGGGVRLSRDFGGQLGKRPTRG